MLQELLYRRDHVTFLLRHVYLWYVTKSALKCYVNITGTYQGEIVLKTTKSPRFRKSYENVT